MDNIRMHLIIQGRVQGVWFRDSTRREAISHGVFGWVRNLPDGSVEVLAEGPEDRVNALVDWCRHGPRMARVDNVHVKQEEWQGEFDTFEVVYY